VKQYIYINDSNKNTCLWEIYSETDNTYLISSRETTSEILKEKCFYKNGYSLLWTDEVRDVESSNIELESESEYEEWLYNERRNTCQDQN
jgi:hypothetical protein